MAYDVSVIIVNWNARQLLPRCLDAVFAEATRSGLSVETIVVDNDSSDDSVAFIRDAYPAVQVIETGKNGGMAAGNNAGMLAARGDSFLLLNSDAFLQPGSLTSMFDTLRRDSTIGMVSPQLLNEDGSIQRSARGFPTVWRLCTEYLYLRKLGPRTRMFNAFYRGDFAHDCAADMEWVMGACMMVKRELVDSVGLMNEAYFMYSEEIDWQHRMHAAGWRVRFQPAAEVVHIGGGSSSRSWGALYPRQVTSTIRYLATCVSTKTAARAQRWMSMALRLRHAMYAIAARLPIAARDTRAARAAAFAAAGQAVRTLDVHAAAHADIPDWPVKREPRASSIER